VKKIMDVEISPTRKIIVLGLDKRSVNNIAYCAATFGVNRLYWIDGYLLCLEVYEKSFEHELKKKEFPVSQICYAEFPKYEKIVEIDKSFQIPLVDVSDMEIFQSILKAILANEKQMGSKAKIG
jgi:hypothetical protein